MSEGALSTKTYFPSAMCHLTLSIIIMGLCGVLFVLQAIFIHNLLPTRNWKWPVDELPVGFIAAGAMLLPTFFSVVGACIHSRCFLTTAFVLCACGVIVSTTSGLNGIVHYIVITQHQYAVLTVAVVSFTVGLFGIIHMSVMCVDLCHCGLTEPSQSANGKPAATKQSDALVSLPSLSAGVANSSAYGCRYPDPASSTDQRRAPPPYQP